ncbi:MAG: helix-turn-helix domain-containing protein [Ignavibacteriaceae bacterium]|nr:helix-turn-helix domain-containing protein [Ignavibacteriaceae bacterium]
MNTTLFIKNMVCGRCIKVVKSDLESLGHKVINISLGEAVVANDINQAGYSKLKEVLEDDGFELLEDKKAKIIEQIKIAVINRIHHTDIPDDINFSEYLEKELDLDYNYLSSLFSSTENITIEHYIISQKIEKAKELLKYGELTLSEIAYKLGYKSVQHLSNQFRQITGFTASSFKNLTDNKRKSLDKVNNT